MMKKIVSNAILGLIIFWQGSAFSAEVIEIDLAKAPKSFQEDRAPGMYTFNVTNLAPLNYAKYEFKVDRESLGYADLTRPGNQTTPFDVKPKDGAVAALAAAVDCSPLTDAIDKLLAEPNEAIIPLLIKGAAKIDGCPAENTRAAVAISLTNGVVNVLLKEGTKSTLMIKRDDKSWSYQLNSDLPGKFVSNWGVAILPNQDEGFFSKSNGDGGFDITEKKADGISLIPAVFYTYVPDFDPDKPLVHGVSLGLGLDQDNVSLFAGYNWTFRTKLGFTIGIAVHQQERLLGEYTVGQTLTESIETLTEDQYQLNVFGALVYGF